MRLQLYLSPLNFSLLRITFNYKEPCSLCARSYPYATQEGLRSTGLDPLQWHTERGDGFGHSAWGGHPTTKKVIRILRDEIEFFLRNQGFCRGKFGKKQGKYDDLWSITKSNRKRSSEFFGDETKMFTGVRLSSGNKEICGIFPAPGIQELPCPRASKNLCTPLTLWLLLHDALWLLLPIYPSVVLWGNVLKGIDSKLSVLSRQCNCMGSPVWSLSGSEHHKSSGCWPLTYFRITPLCILFPMTSFWYIESKVVYFQIFIWWNAASSSVVKLSRGLFREKAYGFKTTQ